MSGIFGVFYLEGKPVKPTIMNRMQNSLRHLGEDDTGIWYKENVGL